MDVTLVQFDIHQRSLLELLRAPGSEISVHFVAEELVHHVVAIGLAHNHQSGVLRQRFRQKRCALDLGSDDLVGPPLVSHFVGDDVRHHIDVIRFLQIGDKADRLGIRHRAWKGLCKARYAWELDDAGLLVLVRPELASAVFDRIGDRFGHFWDVPSVIFVIIDLRVDVADFASFDLVSGGDKRVEIQRWMIDSVAVVVTVPFLPLFDERSGCHGDLIVGGTDDRLDTHPVGILGDVVDLAVRIAISLQFGQRIDRLETKRLAASWQSDPSGFVVTERGGNRVVEKSTVLDHLRVADLVFDSPSLGPERVLHFDRLARLHRGIDHIRAHHQALIVFFELGPRDRDLRIKTWCDIQIETLDWLIALIGNALDCVHRDIASLWKDVDLVLDRLDLRLSDSIEARISLFVVCLDEFLSSRADESVQKHGVIRQPSSHT